MVQTRPALTPIAGDASFQVHNDPTSHPRSLTDA